MPTNMFQSRAIFDDRYNVNILATMEGLRSPGMMTIDAASVSADDGGSKVIRPGSIIVSGNGAAAGFGRVLPASTATVATSVAQNTLTLVDISSFRVGDILVQGLPGATTAVGTIASINSITRVVTLTANATTAVVIGAQIWVSVAAITVKGIVLRATDLLNSSNDVAYHVAASVYGARMPFWNSLIQTQLPGIVLV